MIVILISIFFVAFFLNLLWELLHSVLYTTCLTMQLPKYVRLIVMMSIKDSLWIILFYLITMFVVGGIYILQDSLQLSLFLLISLSAGFLNETISLRLKRWEYAPSMPKLFGVGITPLLEYAVTGLLSFLIVF